jgi:hypothetical protein
MVEDAPDITLRLSADHLHGFAMAAYYGGRAECRIRKVQVPVAYCDFRSMYPTVNALMGLWRFLTAQRLRVVDATYWTQAFLSRVSLDVLFDPTTWRELAVLVEVEPDGDVVPVRARYASSRVSDPEDPEGKTRGGAGAFTIGHNPLTGEHPLWFTLPDLVASTLATGRAPRVRRALRFQPGPRQRGLGPILLRGAVLIDPRADDFFREVVRARGGVKADGSLPEAEREALQLFLKVLANAASYGIFVQLNRKDGETAEVEVFGGDRFLTKVDSPEDPGDFYIPPLGALITGAARLMLALAEHEVCRRGGGHAFMDTDSIAVVATEQGGLVPCPGGPALLPHGTEAVRALSWDEVEAVRERFAVLNPYGDGGSILELEKENFVLCGLPDHKPTCACRGIRRELWCLAIVAKRYTLFNRNGEAIVVRKATEHGLGAYLLPTDRETGKPVKDWVDQAWERIVRDALGVPAAPWPEWAEQLATTRLAISTPTMLGWFGRWNAANPKEPQGSRSPTASASSRSGSSTMHRSTRRLAP